MRQTRHGLREAAGSVLAAVLLVATADALSPAQLAAQQQQQQQQQLEAGTGRPALFEGYLSRVRTDPAVVGERTRLAGIGARLLQPLAAPVGGAGDRPAFLDRVALGGFVTYAPDADRGLTAWHYGAQTDVSLLSRRLASVVRVEPLFSLGVGAFSARRSGIEEGAFTECRWRPADLPIVAGTGADPCADARGRSLGTRFALSPALAARAWLLPDVALRADAREVIVGGKRGVFELTMGLSFAR